MDFPELGSLHRDGLVKQQELSANRLSELEATIEKCVARNSRIVDSSSSKVDWTQSYSFWSQWEDVEDLTSQKSAEEDNYSKLMSKSSDFMGHTHDHAKERDIFYLPENEKMLLCEQHRLRGNHLFHEGIYPKAAEHYQTAISYYEYCFPETKDIEEKIEVIRHACLCNISLCFLRMNEYRKAIDAATIVIQENPSRVKAYFRRAQAYRQLEEFDLAQADLRVFTDIAAVADAHVQYEYRLLSVQKQNSLKREQSIARTMLGVKQPSIETKEIGQCNSGLNYWSPFIDPASTLEALLNDELSCALYDYE